MPRPRDDFETRTDGVYETRGVRRGTLRAARARKRRRQGVLGVVALLVGTAILIAIDLSRGTTEEPPVSVGISSSAAAGSPAASASPVPSLEPVVLQMSGKYPADGPNNFSYFKTAGPVLGTKGAIKRFRVAVESNLQSEMPEFARMVDETLGDPRSWIASKTFRLQRVGDGQPFDFTVYLATGETTARKCSLVGAVTRVNGKSYTSCRLVKHVFINLERWRNSIPDYVNAKTPLNEYRHYVINHEVGHELNHQHELCPGAGKLAPTMMQQTLGLKECVANPWPYVDGKRYAGPPKP